MKRLFLALFTIAFATNVYAAPGSVEVSGTVADGETITITGTGFGVKSPAKPLIWAPFDSNINPSSLGVDTAWTDLQPIEGLAWDSNEGINNSGVATATFPGGSYPEADLPLTIGVSDQVWNALGMRWYIFRKTKMDFDAGNINWKVLRVWAWDGTLADPHMYINAGDSCVNDVVPNGSGSWHELDGPITDNVIDQWATEEIINLNNSANGSSDGFMNFYTNGEIAFTDTALDWDRNVGIMAVNFVVHAVAANSYPSNGDRFWADDVYVDITHSRVMIGSKSTWTNQRNGTGDELIEVQIPSAWSNTSITATVNLGESFATDDTAYLYVVDASNDANENGYPVTIGESAADTTAPDVDSTTIGTDGETVTIVFTETVVTTGYDNGDFDLDCDTSNIALNFISGTGDTRTFTAASVIYSGESCTLDYTGTTDEIEDSSGNDLSLTEDSVTNNSTQSSDADPPVLSNTGPSGLQEVDTASVNMVVTTDETAECKYHLSDVAFASMAGTFSSTNSTSHSQSISTSNGQTYTYYVRCEDIFSNANTSSETITWSIDIDSPGSGNGIYGNFHMGR